MIPRIDPEKLDRYEKKWEEDKVTEEGKKFVRIAGGEQRAHDIFISGEWLWDELASLGCDAELCGEICFANGQKCWVSQDAWEVAIRTLEQFREHGAWDEPGKKLAEKLCNEAFGFSGTEDD